MRFIEDLLINGGVKNINHFIHQHFAMVHITRYSTGLV